MSSKITKKPRQGNFINICRTCGPGCCNGARPPLTPKRQRIIENFLKANNIPLHNPFENKEYVFPKETQDGYCIFFDKATRKCLIHPVKPETCVAGPITFDINKNTGKIEWFLKTEKICPLACTLYQDKKSFEKHSKSAKREVTRLVQELDKRALNAILTINESDTFKTDEDPVHSKVIAKSKR